MNLGILTSSLLTLVTILGACSRDDAPSRPSLLAKKDGQSQQTNGGEKDKDKDKDMMREIDSSGAGFQVKDLALLRSSVDSCMGSDLLKVTDDMLLPANLGTPSAKLPEGRIRFLLSTQYTAGDDIIEKERGNLLDLGSGARTNISADGLTDTYLRSLETIGNVIAHNCSPNNPNCVCAGKEQALAMMTRCLPGMNPNTVEMAESADLLGAICGLGIDGMRRAVASLISSYAFALAR